MKSNKTLKKRTSRTARKLPEGTPVRELPPGASGKENPPETRAALALGELGLRVPAILLEGDEPAGVKGGGPELKFSRGPQPPPPVPAGGPPGGLPPAYGTGRVRLVARDPHCLYAQWDFSREQQQRFNSASQRDLYVRVHQNEPTGPQVAQLQVHPESHHWFIQVDKPGTKYVAELGYYRPDGAWESIAASESVTTPNNAPATDRTSEFATLTFAPSQAQAAPTLSSAALVPPAQRPKPKGVPSALRPQADPTKLPAGLEWELARDFLRRPRHPMGTAPQPLKGEAISGQELVPGVAPPEWTPAQETALQNLLEESFGAREWIDSAEIALLLRRQQRIGPLPEAIFSPAGLEAISSPAGPGPAQKGFWFNVNAELVIYGATEPDAQVSLGGKAVRLRPDGSFSCRFALPDGQYELPVVATASHGEARSAELKFSRETKLQSGASHGPTQPGLKPPSEDQA